MPHPPRRLLSVLLAGLLHPALAGAAPGEDETRVDAPRPRVGLVLSGGGARGAAHVGVIQVLEELQVPVDFVVGTSMGAIVGGLYATGYSPEELERILTEADWGALLSDAPPRDQLWFRRRQDNRRFQVDAELGWSGWSPVLPPGLLLGRNVEAFLERLTLSAAELRDFDSLRIPFRCVATDIATGEPVVFGGGRLARVIRASMSLPGIFAPVELEGRLLVDGGVVDNLPVGVARELGAEVLIVVDISTPLAPITRLSSSFEVSDQVVNILMSKRRDESMALLREGDVAIEPDLGDITVMAFERSVDAIEIGREAADGIRDRLRPLGVGDDAWAAFLEQQRRGPEALPVVRTLRVDPRTRLSEDIVRKFTSILVGEPLTPERLAETRAALAGLGIFERIEIDVEPAPSGPEEVDVVVRPVEKAWGPHYVRFGLGISSDLGGDGEFDAGIQHTATPLNAYGGEWRNEVQLGTRTRLFTEFYQPLDVGLRWFVSPSVEFVQDNLPIIADGQKLAEVVATGLGAGVSVGRNLGNWGELRMSYQRLSGKIRPEIALPGLLPSEISVEQDEVGAALLVDTLDSLVFPRTGLLAQVEATRSLPGGSDTEPQTRVQSRIGVPVTAGGLTVFSSVEGGAVLDGESGVGAEFQLGGFRRLSGLGPGDLSGNHYALLVVQPYWQLAERSSAFGMGRYVGASLELGGLWQDLDALDGDDLRLGGSVYLGLDTLLGPVFLGLGLTEGGERAAYVFVGPIL